MVQHSWNIRLDPKENVCPGAKVRQRAPLHPQGYKAVCSIILALITRKDSHTYWCQNFQIQKYRASRSKEFVHSHFLSLLCKWRCLSSWRSTQTNDRTHPAVMDKSEVGELPAEEDIRANRSCRKIKKDLCILNQGWLTVRVSAVERATNLDVSIFDVLSLRYVHWWCHCLSPHDQSSLSESLGQQLVINLNWFETIKCRFQLRYGTA